MDKDEGFWVRFHIKYGFPGHIEYGYSHYKYIDGFKQDDDGLFKAEAEQWAQETEGWKHDRYSYGFTTLSKTPLNYINEKIQELELRLIFYRGFVE